MAKHQRQSPENYIRTKARSLPFHECLINEEWKEKGLATIFISKRQASGNYIYAIYLVDVFCLGLKNTLYSFNCDELNYNEMKRKYVYDYIPCDIVHAHNIIYGAIDYAGELGFHPQKDFRITEYILDPELIDDGIDEIEFGSNGKPIFIAGPDDNVNRIINILNNSVGSGNYEYIMPLEQELNSIITGQK